MLRVRVMDKAKVIASVKDRLEVKVCLGVGLGLGTVLMLGLSQGQH